ncbi:hypothetical protein A8C56_21270 [Niabella ginsenosidivorans]|uniref:Tyr recombinase domain-containing protein n=1 Tax=Niabella ginsenosidivorans TaxID=1176587 RepID=A0A1A9I9H0_9BACT|nr:site-specific integrase [Niabella ginsenosidivorans]ANH83174.1 hypothetical protein A8C56_21270 [Niabella ginsenosidivorans]
MNKQHIFTQIIPDYRRTMQDDRYPLKLKITYKGERRYYGTGYTANKKEWELINDPNPRGKYKTTRNEIVAIETKAMELVKKIVPFSFREFQEEFFEKPIKYQTLKNAFDELIAQLKKEDRVGTATNYQTTINALEIFRPNMRLENVTIKYLQDFENDMLARNNSLTTVGIYLRNVRAVVNKAIADGYFNPKFYPFGRNKYQIPTTLGTKRSLSKEQLKKIFEYQAASDDYFVNRSLAFWKLSYLANGLNMRDIANLRWENLQDDIIVVYHEKTKRLNRQRPKRITVIRNKIINNIIGQWGNKPGKPQELVFNIVDATDDAQIRMDKVLQFIKVTNKWMKRIGTELGFGLSLTTYVARHSFSTMLLRSGASVEFISESLGHSDIKTTQFYLGGFDLEAKKKMMKALVDFG